MSNGSDMSRGLRVRSDPDWKSIRPREETGKSGHYLESASIDIILKSLCNPAGIEGLGRPNLRIAFEAGWYELR